MDIRAPRQHARFIERRGAILRHALHTAEEQMRREGIVAHFDSLLANAIFAGNSLTHVGGVTPYNVVLGRQPAMLPPLEIDDDTEQAGGGPEASSEPAGSGGAAEGASSVAAGSSGETQPSRRQWRIREIALQRMIEATSIARVNRALRTRTVNSGEGRYRVSDLVEVHRPPSSKDDSGWFGPATVTDVNPAKGQITVRYKSGEMRCRLQDVRHFIGAVFDEMGDREMMTQDKLRTLLMEEQEKLARAKSPTIASSSTLSSIHDGIKMQHTDFVHAKHFHA